MQDFSHIHAVNASAHSLQADYDREAKAILLQVEQDLRNGRKIITWTIIKPNPDIERHKQPENSLPSDFIGLALLCLAWWAMDQFWFDNLFREKVAVFYYGVFVIFIGLFVVLPMLYMLILKPIITRYFPDDMAQYFTICVCLDLIGQRISTEDSTNIPSAYSFRRKSWLAKWYKLPPFALPQTETAHYAALRDKLQREISEITGLAFKE